MNPELKNDVSCKTLYHSLKTDTLTDEEYQILFLGCAKAVSLYLSFMTNSQSDLLHMLQNVWFSYNKSYVVDVIRRSVRYISLVCTFSDYEQYICMPDPAAMPRAYHEYLAFIKFILYCNDHNLKVHDLLSTPKFLTPLLIYVRSLPWSFANSIIN